MQQPSFCLLQNPQHVQHKVDERKKSTSSKATCCTQCAEDSHTNFVDLVLPNGRLLSFTLAEPFDGDLARKIRQMHCFGASVGHQHGLQGQH